MRGFDGPPWSPGAERFDALAEARPWNFRWPEKSLVSQESEDESEDEEGVDLLSIL